MLDDPLFDGTLAGGRWLAETTSTNSVLLAEETPTPYVLGADVQTAGRGRPGKRWTGGRGCLMFSLAVSDAAHPLACGLAVCEAVEPLIGSGPGREGRPAVKWPNDVWVGDRKLAGILIEARAIGPAVRTVIGVGLNVANEPPPGGTSLRELAESAPDSADVLTAVVRGLLSTGRRWDADVRGRVAERDALRGRRVRTDAGEGVAGGIDADGALLVDGRRVVSGGAALVTSERRP